MPRDSVYSGDYIKLTLLYIKFIAPRKLKKASRFLFRIFSWNSLIKSTQETEYFSFWCSSLSLFLLQCNNPTINGFLDLIEFLLLIRFLRSVINHKKTLTNILGRVRQAIKTGFHLLAMQLWLSANSLSREDSLYSFSNSRISAFFLFTWNVLHRFSCPSSSQSQAMSSLQCRRRCCCRYSYFFLFSLA